VNKDVDMPLKVWQAIVNDIYLQTVQQQKAYIKRSWSVMSRAIKAKLGLSLRKPLNRACASYQFPSESESLPVKPISREYRAPFAAEDGFAPWRCARCDRLSRVGRLPSSSYPSRSL